MPALDLTAERAARLSQEIAESRLHEMSSAPAGPRADSSERVVLVVDDETDMVLATFVEVLERKGFQVLAASNGEEALSHLRERDVHIMLTDRVMPA